MKPITILLLLITILFIAGCAANTNTTGSAIATPVDSQASANTQVNTPVDTQTNPVPSQDTQNVGGLQSNDSNTTGTITPAVQDMTVAQNTNADTYTNIQSATDDFNNINAAIDKLNVSS